MPYLQYQHYGPQNDVTLKMPAFEWVHVQLHQQKGDDKFITTDYLQQCLSKSVELHDKVIGHYLNIKHYQ